METPTVATLVAQLVRLQLEESEDLYGFFITGQKVLTRLQSRVSSLRDPLQRIGLNGLPIKYENNCYTGKLQPAKKLH